MSGHALVIASHGARLIIESPAGELLPALAPKRVGRLFCGDEVVWRREGTGQAVVVERLPRRSLLVRHDERGRGRPLCANLDRIVVVNDPTTRDGQLHRNLLDRYLVSAELDGLEALICVNKVDRCDGARLERLRRTLAVYEGLGYPCLFVSAHEGQGIETLADSLKGRRSVLVGESGAGKSSLINRLVPGREARTGELGGKTGFGRHTTSATILYRLPTGGELVDSPGVRSFALGRVDSTRLARGFREFRPLIERCRFRNCRHENDLGCAIRAAAEEGGIDPERYASYRQILAESAEEYRSPAPTTRHRRP